VKAHPFFQDIDWDKVYAKGLAVPKPKTKKITPYMFTDRLFIESNTGQSEGHLDDWSFVVDETDPRAT
jgi:hypothetical protein